jgi:hypothetical protein
MDRDIVQWLQDLPIEEPVEIGGELIYLTVRDEGAELGAYLIDNHSHAQLENALRNGFHSAGSFDAGLGLTADGKVLVLNQWLPKVGTWEDAAKSLEKLLNQLGTWREDMGGKTATAKIDTTTARTEQRLRSLLNVPRS